MRYVLDSNAFSGLVRKVPRIVARYEELLFDSAEFILCPIVYYDVRRGFEKIEAFKQLGFLERILAFVEWSDFTQEFDQERVHLYAQSMGSVVSLHGRGIFIV